MDTDTYQTVVFRETASHAVRRLIPLCIIALVAGCITWALQDQLKAVILGSALVLGLLGVCAALLATVIYRGYRILTISKEGFSDTNIAAEVVPWDSVERISVATTVFRGRERNLAVAISIKDSAWDRLTLSFGARLNKRQTGTMWVGAPAGIDLQDLLEILKSYARAHGGKVD